MSQLVCSGAFVLAVAAVVVGVVMRDIRCAAVENTAHSAAAVHSSLHDTCELSDEKESVKNAANEGMGAEHAFKLSVGSAEPSIKASNALQLCGR